MKKKNINLFILYQYSKISFILVIYIIIYNLIIIMLTQLFSAQFVLIFLVLLIDLLNESSDY